MVQANSKADWSDEHWKDRLRQQRVSMWPDDTVAMLAAWMKLRRGMTAVDIGCGLGYLGYTYWPHFGEGGHYIGVDVSLELVRDARKAADEWAVNGKASFYVANGCRHPLPDDVADCVMCQTLLMHLEKPEAALSEMIRVAKPGALILCKEPDNQSWWQARHYSSLPEKGIDDFLRIAVNTYPGIKVDTDEKMKKLKKRILGYLAKDPTMTFYELYRSGKLLG